MDQKHTKIETTNGDIEILIMNCAFCEYTEPRQGFWHIYIAKSVATLNHFAYFLEIDY